MFKHMLAAVTAVALIAAPAAPAFAQAKTETKTETKTDQAKPETKATKTLTPQQMKMKTCGAKWQAHKKEKNVKGQAEYRKFLSTCLKA
jgi:hypothetical protein